MPCGSRSVAAAPFPSICIICTGTGCGDSIKHHHHRHHHRHPMRLCSASALSTQRLFWCCHLWKHYLYSVATAANSRRRVRFAYLPAAGWRTRNGLIHGDAAPHTSEYQLNDAALCLSCLLMIAHPMRCVCWRWLSVPTVRGRPGMVRARALARFDGVP